MTKKQHNLIRQMVLISLAACVTGAMLFPLVWIGIISLKKEISIVTWPPIFLPDEIDFTNYVTIWQRGGFGQSFKNSSIVAGATMFLTFCIAMFPAYAMSRFKFRGSSFLPLGILLVQLVPPIALLIPFFLFFKRAGLLNTYFGLVLMYTTFSVPIFIWMLKGYLDSIPTEIEEAAHIDGCNTMQVMLRIILPLALPGIGGAFLYTLMLCWQEFIFALTLMRSMDMRTLPVAVVIISSGKIMVPWKDLATACIVTLVPIIPIFLLFQKFLIHGLSAGALKE